MRKENEKEGRVGVGQAHTHIIYMHVHTAIPEATMRNSMIMAIKASRLIYEGSGPN